MLKRIGEGALETTPVALPLLGTVGVSPRTLPAASRFLNDSHFSRCSRSLGGGLGALGFVVETILVARDSIAQLAALPDQP